MLHQAANQPVSETNSPLTRQTDRRLTNQTNSYSAGQTVIQVRKVFIVEITHEFSYCVILQMQHKWQQWDSQCIYLSMPHTFTGPQSCILLLQSIIPTLYAWHFTFNFILLLRKKTLLKCLTVTWENCGKPQDMLVTAVGLCLRLELAQPSNISNQIYLFSVSRGFLWLLLLTTDFYQCILSIAH